MHLVIIFKFEMAKPQGSQISLNQVQPSKRVLNEQPLLSHFSCPLRHQGHVNRVIQSSNQRHVIEALPDLVYRLPSTKESKVGCPAQPHADKKAMQHQGKAITLPVQKVQVGDKTFIPEMDLL